MIEVVMLRLREVNGKLLLKHGNIGYFQIRNNNVVTNVTVIALRVQKAKVSGYRKDEPVTYSHITAIILYDTKFESVTTWGSLVFKGIICIDKDNVGNIRHAPAEMYKFKFK